MINPNQLAEATVVQLRQFAKERGITLSGLTTKVAILERIQTALEQRVAALMPSAATVEADKDSPAEKAALSHERKAMIISDDGDEGASLRGPAPRPAATAAGKPQLTSTGKTKPPFTLVGARAWHNPQPFSAAQPPPSKYAPTLSTQISTLGGSQGNDGSQQRPLPRVSRFGPDAVKAAAPAPLVPATAPVLPQGYRPAAFAQPSALQQMSPRVYTPVVEPAAPRPTAASYPASVMTRPAHEPVQELVRDVALNGVQIADTMPAGELGDGAGVLEAHADGYGFLRAGNYLQGRNDIYISSAQIRKFRLRNGDYVEGKTRPQREGDRYAAMLQIAKVNGQNAEEMSERRDFDELTPIYPHKRIALSSAQQNDPVLRFIDLFAPIGFGQRALIVAPPKAGKTTIIKKIATSIRALQPETHLMLLLVDERPEEVTDLKESIGGDVIYSTFDEPAESHARVSELVMERAMRLVEVGRNVVILMDSLTRLSRAHNMIAPNSARIMSGGLAAGALNRPKRLFGAARNMKEGGSLTIIATCIVETGSRMDDVIYEEFKGTGNMELTLDRSLQERRLFPAVSILKSGTRHEELLLTPQEMEVAHRVRGMIAGASEQEGISMVLSMMEKTRDNEDFVARFEQWAKIMNTR